MRNSLFVLVVFVGFSCTGPQPGKQVWVDKPGDLDGYWIYLPESYDETETYPVVLFLQGGLGSGPDPRSSKENGPARWIGKETPADLQSYVADSFLIINPHMSVGPREKRQWFQFDKQILAILDEVEDTFSVGQVIITGLSRGGLGSWEIAKRHPDRFSALVPVAGAIRCKDDCEGLEDMPLWIIHNTGDPTISIDYAYSTIEYLQNSGSDIRVSGALECDGESCATIIERDGHDAWTNTYSHVGLYRWMLDQVRCGIQTQFHTFVKKELR